MSPLYTLLTNGTNDAFIKNIPIIVVCGCIAVMLFAFCIGIQKNVRFVNWFGTAWVFIGVLFFAIRKFFGVDNPIADAVQGQNVGGGLAVFLPNALIAFVCILLGLFVYGIFTKWLRPTKRIVKKQGDRFFKDERGVDYDPETDDYDDYETYNSMKMVERKGYQTPSLLSRISGGIVCTLNVSIVLFFVIALAFYAIAVMGWDMTTFHPVMKIWWVDMAKRWVYSYAMDFVLIGVVFKIALVGYNKGFVESLRVLLVKVGVWAAVAISFYLPFSAMATSAGVPLLHTLTTRFMNAMRQMGLTEFFVPFVGKLCCGAAICVLALLIVWLINWLFKKFADAIDSIALFRTLDGTLSCVIYALIGVLICFGAGMLIYVCGHFGIFYFPAYVSETSLSSGLYQVCQEILSPMLETMVGAIKGFLGT